MSSAIETRPDALSELEPALQDARTEIWVAEQVAQLAPTARLDDELVAQAAARVRAKLRPESSHFLLAAPENTGTRTTFLIGLAFPRSTR